jgi:hypothetical protein
LLPCREPGSCGSNLVDGSSKSARVCEPATIGIDGALSGDGLEPGKQTPLILELGDCLFECC